MLHLVKMFPAAHGGKAWRGEVWAGLAAARPRQSTRRDHCHTGRKSPHVLVTKEDHETPSNAELVADDTNNTYEEHGLILPTGDCPCLRGVASGPCGQQFTSAFSCFHYCKEEIKESDSVDQFWAMQECMQKYPDLYPQEDEEEEEGKTPAEGVAEAAASEATAIKEEKGPS
ncbi:mitochondrial intermembrane space import and assembly protein 40-like [Ochotona curzoniae]|uniref:mitochondrial intermembrane space import and assembly protein 40-like n=1 Tax=Ochotona curzoniae TaxID=130825 RepID=UPI001B3487F0|nr:mitochondrial intermembrane space import and assembly protein 40-like [Ochotona curzoniae]